MQINFKDVWSGLIFIAMGAAFALTSQFGLRIGSGLNMGPGYFPRFLGIVLALLGIIILIGALNKANSPIGKVSWRGIGLVTAALFYFGFGVRTLGLVPAIMGCVVMASLASDRVSILRALTIAAVLTVFASALFVYALGLPIPLIGPWLGGY
jgi:putative tricarboxylic transport membrane protein